MIIRLNFSNQLLNPKGETVGQTLGELLSNLLMSQPAKPPLSAKYFIWGLELIRSGIIELDEVDKKSLQELIDNSDTLTVLAKGRLNEVLSPMILPSNPEVKQSEQVVTEEDHKCPQGEIWNGTACVPDVGKIEENVG